jgi:hypothetical protein
MDGLTYLIDPNMPWKEQTPLSLPPLSDAGERFVVSDWSSDGCWLAGGARTADGQAGGVVIYSLESQQYRTLTEIGGFPIWTPDCRRLLFLSFGKGLHSVDIESGGVDEVLNLTPDIVLGAVVSPNNRWLYFTRVTTAADIWMLTLNEEQK